MKRRFLMVAAVLLILVGIFLLMRIAAATFAPKGKGALQITSNIKAAAYLDNKPIGDTPLCHCEGNDTIESGKHELRIVPEDRSFAPFSAKIEINTGVLTAVDRTFLPGSFASAYILTLAKNNSSDPQFFIASIPEGALVELDGESKGITPILLDPLSASEHEVEIQKQGFSKKTVRIRAVPSYRVVLNVLLGTKSGVDESIEAPDQKITPTQAASIKQDLVLIKDTPTGFLRVREQATTASREVGRVNPQETYVFLDENTSWFKIELRDKTIGWVSKQYAEKTIQ